MIDYRIGDGRALIANVPDGSVHLVATSPPFLALRSYLPADHEHKHAEIGSEPDPATFLDTLLTLTAEWGRVLAPWGSIAIELGDTYAGDDRRNGETVDIKTPHRSEVGRAGLARANVGRSWPRAKSLALIPQSYATSLAYGRNILTGAPSPAGQWLVRNLIVWHRPNPAVGALGDKFRPSTSYIVVATRSPKRWFDLTAVRNGDSTVVTRIYGERPAHQPGNSPLVRPGVVADNPAGAPPLDAWFDEHDTWTVTTQPSKLAHYAMWPAKLAERLILSMCPEWVCSTCGEPRRRIERVTGLRGCDILGSDNDRALGLAGNRSPMPDINRTTLGWTDCGHDDYAPGVVLDPFAGTFTTGLVAEYHGRDALGFDLDRRNADLVPLRRDEIRRNLNPTHVRQVDGQIEMFGEVVA